MKLPLAAALAAATFAAAPAAARAADLTSTVSGPSGTVWSGAFPATMSEENVDQLSPICRALGYTSDDSAYHTVLRLGGTTLTDTRADGTIANLEQVTADGHWVRTNYLPGGGSVVTDCTISNGSIASRDCSRSENGRKLTRAPHRRAAHASRHR